MAIEYLEDLMRWRAERDHFFKEHYASPLPDEIIEIFTGLDYFEVDESLVFEAVISASAAETITIDSSTGSASEYPFAGVVEIPFPGGPVALVALRGEEDEAFIPFRDRTCGKESYGGGRYVSIEIGDNGSCTVDFNKAINPYCVYDAEFSCPLPPTQTTSNP